MAPNHEGDPHGLPLISAREVAGRGDAHARALVHFLRFECCRHADLPVAERSSRTGVSVVATLKDAGQPVIV